MKICLLATGLVANLGFASQATAQDVATSAKTPGGFEFGVEAFDYAFRERDGGATIVRDDGRFGGLEGRYIETLGGSWLLTGKLNLAWGSVDYRSDIGAQLDDVPQSIGRLEIVVGHDIRFGAGAVTPFVGLGSRVLYDESGGRNSSDGAAGYDRTVVYGYVPVGAQWRALMGRRSKLSITGQVNVVTTGHVESRFSDVDPDAPDVKLDLNGGTGWELAAALELALGRGSISFGPFARGWRISKSDSRTFTDDFGSVELFEPASRTAEVGIKAMFRLGR